MKTAMGPVVVNAVTSLILVLALCASIIEHTEVVSLQPGAGLLFDAGVTRRRVSLRGSTYPVKFVKVADLADVELVPIHAVYERRIDAGAGADVHLGTVQYSHEVQYRVKECGCESAALRTELRYVQGLFGHPHAEVARPIPAGRTGSAFCPLMRRELYELDLAVPPQPLSEEISGATGLLPPRGSLFRRLVWMAGRDLPVPQEPGPCPIALEVVLDLQSPQLRPGAPQALNETGLTQMVPPFLLESSDEAPYLNRVELSVKPAKTAIFPALGVWAIILGLTLATGARRRKAEREEAPQKDASADKGPAPKQ